MLVDSDDLIRTTNADGNELSVDNNLSTANVSSVDNSISTSIDNSSSTNNPSTTNQTSSLRFMHLEGALQNNRAEQDFDNEAISSRSNLPPQRKWTRDHPFKLIIGDAAVGVKTKKAIMDECLYNSFLSQEEPNKVE